MRLKAISLFSELGPVHSEFFELGAVTVLVGPNDSGKTRILGCIASVLQNPTGDLDTEFSEILDLFGTVTSAEFEAFLNRDEVDQDEISDETEPIESFREQLALPADGDEVVIGVRVPLAGLEFLPAWRYGRPLSELSDELRVQVLAAFVATWAPDVDGPGGGPTAAEQIAESRDPREPLKLQYLGGVEPTILPAAIVVPSTTDELIEEAGDAVVQLCRSLRIVQSSWGHVEETLGELDGAPLFDPEPSAPITEPDEPASPSWLLEERRRLHPAATYACEALSRLTEPLLPDFIATNYGLLITPAAPDDLAAGRSIDVRLSRADAGGLDDPPLAFPLGEAASGFQVWLQLALREATAKLQVLTQIIIDGARRASDVGEWLSWTADEDIPADAKLDEVKATLEVVFASLDDPIAVTPESVTAGFELLPRRHEGDAEQQSGAFAPGWVSAFRTRLYLIDEPEQRMHPALQRRAARWLADLMSSWGSQCIVATHSVAFMDMPGDVRVLELVRESGGAAIQPFNLEEFGPHAQLARAMGFDRGELLSRWHAFLFVEGRTDLGVIEELFAERLRRSGVCLLPVHGHRQHTGLLDMAVFTLGTRTPIAALFDAISDEDVQRARSDAAYRATLRAQRGELGSVARIVDLEFEHGREIEILTVGVPDIFDLLDEDLIRGSASKHFRGHSFPGHTQAHDEFVARGGGNATAYKSFLREQYGISTSERTMRSIAREMRARGVVPEVLDEVLMRVERMALQADLDH
jgi:energy-coupling factor transporter ATP-binding protein EcfA2